jgi:protein-tyrosine phosphatase
MEAMSTVQNRLVALQGASNFRDLGGYRGHDERPVRWRRLYRSDHLAGLTESDVAEIRQRQIVSALDFRGVQESAAVPYDVAGLKRVPLSIEPTVAQRMSELVSQGRFLDEAITVGLMEDLYRGIVRSQVRQLQQFFHHLLTTEHPVVFHCTAGKDRTGVAAALLLSALGVARDDVMQDFLITNEVYRPPRAMMQHGSEQAWQALWSVRPQYLQAAWDVIDQEHRGTQAYLRDPLGLGDEQLAALAQRYLEPVN